MLRAIALSLFLLIGLGTVLPFVSSYAEAGAQNRIGNNKKRYKKFSKMWWRARYRRQRRNETFAAQRRALRLRRIRLANGRIALENGYPNQSFLTKVSQKSVFQNSTPALLPSGETAPKNWRSAAANPNESQFRVEDDYGAEIGSASISVVSAAVGADSESLRSKTVGGVSTDSLRRSVIDRMIKEEGWVVNDYRKEIGGRQVFVVAAQSPGAGGKIQSRLFYFTEADGRVYSVSTAAPSDSSRRVEQELERVVTSLRRRGVTVQEAVNR